MSGTSESSTWNARPRRTSNVRLSCCSAHARASVEQNRPAWDTQFGTRPGRPTAQAQLRRASGWYVPIHRSLPITRRSWSSSQLITAARYELYAEKRTTNLGAAQPAFRITRAAGQSIYPIAVADSGTEIVVIFQDDRDGTARVYATRLVCAE